MANPNSSKPKTPKHSGARATPQQAEARRQHVQALMSAGQWQRGRTGRALALEWGVTPMAVRHLAAEVSRALGWSEARLEREGVSTDLDEASDLIREGLELADDKAATVRIKAGAALATIARQRAEVLGLRGAAPSTEPPKDELPFGWKPDAPKPSEQPS